MPDPITQVTFQNAGVLTLAGGFASFGQTFQAGDLLPGQQLLAEIGGQLVAVQVDVRNTHPDGSVKMAVLTMERPELAPWQEATATLLAGGAAAPAAPVSLAQVLAGHSASLTLAIEDGRAPLGIDIGAAVTQAIATGTASFWQQGPFATQARVEIPVENSSLRVVLDVTGYADGEIRFTVGLNNDRAMEAVGGRLNYVATVTLDGATVFEQGLSHGQYQRVSLDFSSNEAHGIQGLGAPQEGWLNIKHDIEYLKAAAAIFQYDTDFVINPGDLRHYYEQVANNPQWGEIFWNHGVAQSMGNAGGRPDIGYTTAPNASWIISQDAAAADYALGQAKVAGYVPWNFYDMANGTVLTTEHYPRLWTDGRGGTGTPGSSASTGLTQQVSTDTGWGPDRAHQPDLSFVPYLLTGERWIYDNVMTQASHSLMDVWPAVRGNGEGIVIRDAQLRSAAWSMRQLEHAAWIAEDGSTEAAFFTKTIADNWNWVLANANAWTATYGEIAGFIPSAAYGDHIPVWQTNMFAGVVALSALRGSTEALQVLDFMSNFLLGALNSASKGFDPHNAAVITIPTAVNGTPLTRWSDVADVMRAAGTYADGAFTYTEQEYHRMLVGGLTMAYAATGDARYRDAVETFLALAPPGARTDNYVRVPQFAVTIRELHDLYMNDPLYPTTANKPAAHVIGTGPDEIVLKISQDWFNGSAQYVISVDGKQVGGVFTASALKSLAEADTVTIRGDFGDTVTVRVQMTNDLYFGSLARDRNLYVNAISYNGEDLPTRAYLANNTPQDFVFKADGTMISPPALVKPEPNVIAIPEIDPLPPKTVALGDGPDEVVIRLNQDWYLDSAKYVVLLDGKQVGGVQEAAAFRSAGETDTLIIRGHFSDGPVKLAIRYVNDLSDGYGRDRNLYVQSATLNGETLDIAPKKSLMAQNETAVIAFERPDLTPKTVVVGSGPDEMVFQVNQNYWQGKSEYVVLVNGVELGGRQTVNALLANGEYDTVIVRGSFPDGTAVGLKFMNDTHAGWNKGRDIFVHAAEMNGAALAVSQWGLLSNGAVSTATVGVPAPPPSTAPLQVAPIFFLAPVAELTPKTVELGEGADQVVVRLNQSWFDGSAEYVVLVDGVQLDGVQVASALRAKNETDTLIIRGEFDANTTIAIRFTNDAYYGNTSADRNLFIQSATFNGLAVAVDQKNLLLTGDTAMIGLSATLPSVPPPSPPPVSEAPPPPPPPPSEPEPPPTPREPAMHVFGSGPDEVVFRISQTPFEGSAFYAVMVAGVTYPARHTIEAQALKSDGVADTVIVRGDFTGTVPIAVLYRQDLGERALHIEGITVNGHAVPGSVVTMADAGMRGFEVNVLPRMPEAEPSPPAPAEPEAEAPPEAPAPPPAASDPGDRPLLFHFSDDGGRAHGLLRIEANGELVFAHRPPLREPGAGLPQTVAIDVAAAGSTEFVLRYDTADATLPAAGPRLAQVVHDGLDLPTLRHDFGASGLFRFTVHAGSAADEVLVGSDGADVFLLNGGADRITTGAGQDLLVVRAPGAYRVTDFNPAQDRLLFEGMAAASLSVTQAGMDTVIGFEGGSVVLEGQRRLALDTIVLNPEALFA
ncbi:carbohydrate-binding domain-containing protein [Elioraea sp.]|uniref:carbohydrate-binding domain-containing protein n=1 Tax=Elioraea sp. TaxID=2185103 RepID=UPI003F71FA3F